MLPFFRPEGTASESIPASTAHQHVQPLQVVGQAHQTPLSGHRQHASQRELAEAQRFFDDADDWLHRGFAQTVDPLADVGLE
jgi:hypothetical protein